MITGVKLRILGALFLLVSGYCGRAIGNDNSLRVLGENIVHSLSEQYKLFAYWGRRTPEKLHLIKIEDLSENADLTLPTGKTIEAILFGKQGQGIYAITTQGQLIQWRDPKSDPRIVELENARYLSKPTALCADGRRVVCGDEKGFGIWDVESGKLLNSGGDTKSSKVLCIAPLPNRRSVLLVFEDHADFIDCESGQVQNSIGKFKGKLTRAEASPGGKFIAGIGHDFVQVIDLALQKSDYAESGVSDDDTFGVHFTEGDQQLLIANTATKKFEIDVWNMNGSVDEMTFAQPIPGRLQGKLVCLPKSKTVSIASGKDLNSSYPNIRVSSVTGIAKAEFGFGAFSTFGEENFTPIAVSPSENLLAVSGETGRLYLWSLVTPLVQQIKDYGNPTKDVTEKQYTGNLIHMMEMPGIVESATFFPDERHILVRCKNNVTYLADTGVNDPRARVTNVAFGSRSNGSPSISTTRLIGIDFSPEGNHLVAWHSNGVTVLNANDGSRHWSSDASLIGAYYDKPGNRILMLGSSESFFFDVASRATSKVASFGKPGPGWQTHKLITGIQIDGQMSVIDTHTAAIVAAVKPQMVQEGMYAISADNRLLGIGGKITEGKSGIEVLDLLNRSTVSAIPVSDDGIYGVAFIGDGSRLAVCGHTRVRLYDYKKKRMVFEFPEPENKPNKKDDEFVPLVGLPSKIFVENSGSFASIGPRVILNMAYHDATSVMAIANFSAVSFWDVNTGKLKWTTAIEGFRIVALSFSGDGSKLAVAHDEGRLTILDLAAVQR